MPEIDETSSALRRTGRRLADLITYERAFTARASHQLRTPLTRLRLRLESGLEADDPEVRSASRSALEIVDQLSTTVDDVLTIARTDDDVACNPQSLVEGLAATWAAPLADQGRRLRVHADPVSSVRLSEPAVRQLLHVLLDNAVRHGRGQVTVVAREAYGAVALDVGDEGQTTPFDTPAAWGLGLRMASSIAEGAHGRLLVNQGRSDHGDGAPAEREWNEPESVRPDGSACAKAGTLDPNHRKAPDSSVCHTPIQ